MAKTKSGQAEKTSTRAPRLDPADILLHLPVAYEDFRRLVPPGQAGMYEDQWGCFVVRAVSAPREVKGEKLRFQVEVTDGQMDMVISGFGKLKFSEFAHVKQGELLYVRAIPKQFGRTLFLSNAALIPPFARGRLVPKYAARRSVISADNLRKAAQSTLDDEALFAKNIDRVREHFMGMTDAQIGELLGRPGFTIRGLLTTLHRPPEEDRAELARGVAKRLAARALIEQARAGASRVVSIRSVLKLDMTLLQQLVQAMPFPLTGAQAKAVERIASGLKAPYAMNMLLSGDVGTGKTASYLLPAVAAQCAGARVGVMIPNLVLARQIEAELKSWFPDVPTLFVGGDGPKPKAEQLADNPIIIGTTAILFQIPKLDWAPDFFIIDEQQKTSVEQRQRLLKPHTNLLEATATCMPRTKALIDHGAIDVVVLNEFPVKKTIRTQIVQASGRSEMFAKLKAVVAEGSQIAIIYPLVEDKEDEETKKSVESAAQQWEKVFPGKVGMMHGKRSDEEKLDTLARMKSGELKVLVASTVVEIGVTIPALKAIMIVHAEKYGVSTLHQMRGRVARHGGEGWCYLYLPDGISEGAMERLQLLEKHIDGFVLAEKDMEMRGFGDLSETGETQHGASRAIFWGLELMPEDVQAELAVYDGAAQPAEEAAKPPAAPARATGPKQAELQLR